LSTVESAERGGGRAEADITRSIFAQGEYLSIIKAEKPAHEEKGTHGEESAEEAETKDTESPAIMYGADAHSLARVLVVHARRNVHLIISV